MRIKFQLGNLNCKLATGPPGFSFWGNFGTKQGVELVEVVALETVVTRRRFQASTSIEADRARTDCGLSIRKKKPKVYSSIPLLAPQ